jgi:tetratricopeptide (TPR) repeat protein
MKSFAFFALAFLGLAAFGASLPNPFLFDDKLMVAANDWLRWTYIPNFFRSYIQDSAMAFTGYRPLVMATLAAQRELTGLNPLPYRLFNLLLHAAVSCLVFVLARDLLKRWTDGDRPLPALAVAALFLLHPVQTNVITLVWKRTDLLVSLGLLGTFLCAGRWIERKGGAGSLAAAYAFALVAFFSKESALLLPAVILLGDLLVWRSKRSVSAGILGLYLPAAALAMALAWLSFFELPAKLAEISYIGQPYGPPSQILSRHDYLLTQSVSLLTYLKLLAVPSGLSVFHAIVPVRTVADPRLWLGLGVLLLLIFVAVRSRKDHPWATFSISWFLLTLLPASSFVPLTLPFDEDRLYLPMFGVALYAVGTGWRLFEAAEKKGWGSLRKILPWAPVLVCALYIPHDILRGRVWSSDLRLWRMNARDEPGDPRAWVNLGISWGAEGRLPEALDAYRRALALSPDYGVARYFRGQTLLKFHRIDEAEEELSLAFRAGIFPHDALASLGLASLEDNDPGAAARFFVRSLVISPTRAGALRNLGKLLDDENDGAAAENVLEWALVAEPWNPETRIRLAYVVWKYDHRKEAALLLLKDALRLRPEDERANRLLAEISGAP